jgi:hypothetical protein
MKRSMTTRTSRPMPLSKPLLSLPRETSQSQSDLRRRLRSQAHSMTLLGTALAQSTAAALLLMSRLDLQRTRKLGCVSWMESRSPRSTASTW